LSSKIEDLDSCCQDAARKTLNALNADSELKNSGVAGWLVIETLRPLQSQIAYASRLMLPMLSKSIVLLHLIL
jgi:hypothetical protein